MTLLGGGFLAQTGGRAFASAFNPLSLSPILWVKDTGYYQDAGITPAGSGDPIGQWADQSGNAHHPLGSGTARPTVLASAQAGRPAARFDGVDDMLLAAFALVTPVTVLIVARVVTTSAIGVLVDGNSPDTMEVRCNAGDPTVMDVYGGAFLTQALPTGVGEWHQTTVVFDGGSGLVRRDGSQVAAGGAGSSNQSGVRLGNYPGGSRPLVVDVGEVIVCPVVLDLASIQAAEAYQKAGWGTP